jgi:hypothetical protein
MMSVLLSFDRLPAARREQVVDYARWLRANPHASLPGRHDRAARGHPAGHASCPSAHATEFPRGTELERAARGLTCEQQELIAEYVIALAKNRGAPGHVLRRFAGTIPEDVLDRIERIIEDEFERIDHDGW